MLIIYNVVVVMPVRIFMVLKTRELIGADDTQPGQAIVIKRELSPPKFSPAIILAV